MISMKLTKDRFSCWEDILQHYEITFDDQLIIRVSPNETSLQMANYILECQEKAKKYDGLFKDE